MSRSDYRRCLTFRILILALFLAAQGIGHAHGSDHPPLADSYECGICSIGSQINDVAIDIINVQPEIEHGVVPVALPPGHIITRQHQTFRARSPPFSC